MTEFLDKESLTPQEPTVAEDTLAGEGEAAAGPSFGEAAADPSSVEGEGGGMPPAQPPRRRAQDRPTWGIPRDTQ